MHHPVRLRFTTCLLLPRTSSALLLSSCSTFCSCQNMCHMMGWTKIGCKLGAAILWQCCCCCCCFYKKKNDEIHGSCLHILQSHEQDDCSKLEGTVNLNDTGSGTVCAKSKKKRILSLTMTVKMKHGTHVHRTTKPKTFRHQAYTATARSYSIGCF